MPKISALRIPYAEPQVREVTITTRDGQSDTLALAEPDLATRLRAREIADDLWSVYGGAGEETPAFPCPDIKPSRSLFAAAALVAEMQVEPEYTVIDLVILFFKDEGVFEQIQGTVNELGRLQEDRRKN